MDESLNANKAVGAPSALNLELAWREAHNNALEAAKFAIRHRAQSMRAHGANAAREFIAELDKLKVSSSAELSTGKQRDWIPITDSIPESGKPVLVACGKKVLRAAHAGKFALDEENWGWWNDGEGADYNEATDTT